MAYINKYRLFHPRKLSPPVVRRLKNLHARQGGVKNIIKPILVFGTFWMEMQRAKPQKLRTKMDKQNGKAGYQAVHPIENDDELKLQEEMLQPVYEPFNGKDQGKING